MAFHDEQEQVSAGIVFGRIKNDPQLGPMFMKVVDFGKRLVIRPHTVSMTQTEMRFSGRLALALFLRMRLARSSDEAIPLLNRLLEYEFFIDVAKIGAFRNADVHYKLFVDQNALDVYVKLYDFREELQSLKQHVTTDFRDGVFQVMLHDIVLLFVERQGVLEEQLERERVEYKNLYLKYQDGLKKDYSFYLGRVRELERELQVERRRNEEKQALIDRLRKKGGGGSESDHLPPSAASGLARGQLAEDLSPIELSRRHHVAVSRLKDDIVQLENQNETLSRHNELLIEKFNRLREAASQAFRQRERQKKEVLEIRAQLADVRDKYRAVLETSASQSESIIESLAQRIEVERGAKEGAMRKVDELEGQITKVQSDLMRVAKKLQSSTSVGAASSGSGKRFAIENSAQVIQGKIQELIRELSE